MILLHLRINLLDLVLNYILEITLSFKFLKIFANYFKEIILNFEDINYFKLADNIAKFVEPFIFMEFFHLDNNFTLIFILELGN